MWRAVPLLVCLPGLAAAQGLADTMRGSLFGSASDPAGSCAVNPHLIEFTGGRPHLLLIWDAPWTNADGEIETNRRYDLLAMDGSTFTLRDEHERQVTEAGDLPLWILRRTTQPEGYCWGRTDWPQLRCEDQQLRCDASLS
jgi:hypothetical protein